jgi:PAS domain S-box-containing protein
MSGPPGSVQPDELERLLAAIDAAQLGTWEHDSASGRMLVSPRLEAMLGLPPGGFAGTFAALLEHVHPDDRACLLAHADEARRTRRDIHVEYRVVLPDGSIRWLEGRGRLRYDGDRELGSTGVVVDVTERRQEQLQRERLAAQVTLQRRAAELLSEFDVGGRLAVLAELLVPTLGDCCAVHLVEPDATIALAAVRHADASKQRWFGELLATFPVTVDQPYGAGAVIATGRAQLLPAVDDDLLAAATRRLPGVAPAQRARGSARLPRPHHRGPVDRPHDGRAVE